MNVVKIFFASLVVAGMVSGCSSKQSTAPDNSAATQAQMREAEEAARQAEEAAKRAEVAAEKAEVIFHKSLQK